MFSSLTVDLTYQLNVTLSAQKHQIYTACYNVELKFGSNINVTAVNFTQSGLDLNDGDNFHSLYPENITLYINYSKVSDGGGITGGTVNVEVGGGAPIACTDLGGGNYSINLFSNDTILQYTQIDNQISIYIEASSVQYSMAIFEFNWVISNASTDLINHNATSFEVFGGNNFDLNLEYQDNVTNHAGSRYYINDCDASNVTMRWGNASKQVKAIESMSLIDSNGTYQITVKFDVYEQLNFELSFTFQRVGYDDATFTYDITVKIYNTSIFNLIWDNPVPLYEDLDLSFLFQHNLSTIWEPITDSAFTLTSNLSHQGFSHFGSGYYNATLNTNLTGNPTYNPGDYNAQVQLNYVK